MPNEKFSKQFSGLKKVLARLRRVQGARGQRLQERSHASAPGAIAGAPASGTLAGSGVEFSGCAFAAWLKWIGVDMASYEDALRQHEIQVLEALALNVFASTERSMGVMARSVGRTADGTFGGETLRWLAQRCPVSNVEEGGEPDHDAATARMTHLYEEGRRAAVSWFPGKRDASAVAVALHAEGEAIAAACDGWDETVTAAVDELVTVGILNAVHRCLAAWIARVSSVRKTGEKISPVELMEWRSRWSFSPEEAQIVAYYGDIALTAFVSYTQDQRAMVDSLREAGRLQRAALPDPTANSAGGSLH